MSDIDDYPYGPIRSALETVFGRIGLVLLAILVGSMLGGLSAMRSLEGLSVGFIGVLAFSLASIFYGSGLWVLPAIGLFAIASTRYEWPLKLTLLCSLLMWLNIHQTIRWSLYDSPSAKLQKRLEEDWNRTKNASQQKVTN